MLIACRVLGIGGLGLEHFVLRNKIFHWERRVVTQFFHSKMRCFNDLCGVAEKKNKKKVVASREYEGTAEDERGLCVDKRLFSRVGEIRK